jgi:hypothetical protein
LSWHSFFEHSFRFRKGVLASPGRITGLWKGATPPLSTEMLSTFDPARPLLWVSKSLEKLASALEPALRPHQFHSQTFCSFNAGSSPEGSGLHGIELR